MDCSENDPFFGATQLPIRATEKALASHSAVKGKSTPVYGLITFGKGVQHTANSGFSTVQKTNKFA